MGIKSVFRRLSGKPPSSFDEVTIMDTHPLPLPGSEKNGAHISFGAQRDSTGQWAFSGGVYGTGTRLKKEVMDEFVESVKAALRKHTGNASLNKGRKVNFDTAFMILREVEEAYFQRANAVPADGKKPANHYTAAYRLLPSKYAEAIDEMYKKSLEKGPTVLSRLASAPAAQNLPAVTPPPIVPPPPLV